MINKVCYTRSSEREKKPSFYYTDVFYNEEGWADAKKFLPINYDLVLVKTKDHVVKTGWSNGFGWDGLNLESEDEVLYWKRR